MNTAISQKNPKLSGRSNKTDALEKRGRFTTAASPISITKLLAGQKT